MSDLITTILDRLAGLVDGHVFDDPAPLGGTTVPILHAHALPVAETAEEKGEQVPYIVARIMGLDQDASGALVYQVRLIAELYTHQGVAEGMADLLRLRGLLAPLALRGPGNLAGYKVLGPVVWRLGEAETGNQPHPFYNLTADLRIAAAG